MKRTNFVRANRMRNWVIFGVLLTSGVVSAETYLARVVGVADGDTITVLDTNYAEHKVRLAGIDAPEKKQAFGHASKEHLSNLVFNKMVTIETRQRDRYQ